ncbi:integrator complex subunit 9 homolog isoform X5 [Phoenix dactylifera]|nr:integrator complex subunit 9 homolog isoform X5 [Phoenix dactylifera]XP_026656153.1 integrator complex subunit 9 homolog isoform X5 [Phoenix dactylifera]XP_038988748.1 integrator complex subunit 9 homolog isoform X5 [Phoenix dactylifera]
MLELCGFRLLLECPLDLSALTVFAPISATDNDANASGLIKAQPWYKTVAALHLWDPSLIGAILVSTPAGMLGLPFLARNPKFSGKIYATEATARIGRLMMEELVAMHAEFVQFYGPDERPGLPEWMKWEELEKLPPALREVVMGEDGEELGSWMPLYSASDIKECMQKVQSVKYAEEVCYNGTIILKAFSSGLEIGSCNWTVNGPRRNITYLSSSIFESSHAMDFDYHSLQGNDLILFSDLSSLNSMAKKGNDFNGNNNHSEPMHKDAPLCDVSAIRTDYDNEDEILRCLGGIDENLEEIDKISFVCSCILDSLQMGGSALIPVGRLGVVLLLLEQLSRLLESSHLKVPIFMISTAAEEMLAFTNAVPEWLCKQRQQKLFSGEALFGHVELMDEKKLLLFPILNSSNLFGTKTLHRMMWQEPCIVFSPHWSLRLGPVVHLLRRWHADPRCVLVVEEGADAEVALLPFKMVAMKVLQCSFLSGIRMQKVRPLLEMLQPKLVLFPEDLRLQCPLKDDSSCSILYYLKNVMLHVPGLRSDFEVCLATDLAFQLKPRKLTERNMAIARLKGQLLLNNGKYLLVASKELLDLSNKQLLHWGSADPVRLLMALQERGIIGSIHWDKNGTDGVFSIQITKPEEAMIETSGTKTVIYCRDKTMAALIYEAFSSVCGGI